MKTKKQRLPRTEYRNYIRSEAWRKVRARYWKSKLLKTCYLCDASSNLQLHHKTYKRLGCEKLTDLIPLCDECHRYLHEKYKEAKEARGKRVTSLWDFAQHLKRPKSAYHNPKKYFGELGW